jgi:hypothetical protein
LRATSIPIVWVDQEVQGLGRRAGRADQAQPFNPGTRRTPEASGPHHYNPHYLPSASWTYPATTRILFEGGVTAYIINQLDKRDRGVSQNDIQITDQGLN